MTEENKIIISKHNDKYILCHLLNDELCHIYAYDETEEDFPIGTIVNGVVEKNMSSVKGSFVRCGKEIMGYIDGDYKCGMVLPVQYKKACGGNKKPLFTEKVSLTSQFAVVTNEECNVRVSSKISKEQGKHLVDKYSYLAMRYNVSILLRTACARIDSDDNSVIEESIIRLCEKIEYIREQAGNRVVYSVLYKPMPQILRDIIELTRFGELEVVSDCSDVIEKIDNCDELHETDRVKTRIYDDNMLSLSKLYSFESKISEATTRIIHLKSGANITFDKTEALMSIDVNSAKSNVKGDREENILKINKEAANAIFKHIILRNISGIIIIDFVNMKSKDSYEELANYINMIFRSDLVKIKFHGFTQLGLAEISRQKIRTSFMEQLR